MLYGIWCKDKSDWLREQNVAVRRPPILAFESKREAQRRARQEYGFASYTEAKKKDWVEVRPLKSH